MSSQESDTVFSGSVPKLYEQYLVPLVFKVYAAELATRLASRSPTKILEIAAGTGVVTRAMAASLHESVAIVATDLNDGMLEQARSIGTCRLLEWRQADAMDLPFPDEAFDAVICSFGVMFFPDKAKAFAEVRRVLQPGGVFMFTTWDRIEENEFVDVVTRALAEIFPHDPPRFHARVPHGYHDKVTIEQDVAAAGFTANPEIATIAERSEARSARVAAMAYCQGTPLRDEIEERYASLLGDATVAVTKALADRFGKGRINGQIQAHLVTVVK